MSTSTPNAVLEAALYWGDSLLAVRRLTEDGQLTLGTADGVDLYIADTALPVPRMVFVQRHGDEVWLQPAKGLKLTVDDQPGPSMPRRLQPGVRAALTVGALQIRLSWTSPSRRVAVPFFAGIDFVYTKVLALALVLQAALVVGMMITPNFDDDDDSLVAQAFRWVQQAPPKQAPPRSPSQW